MLWHGGIDGGEHHDAQRQRSIRTASVPVRPPPRTSASEGTADMALRREARAKKERWGTAAARRGAPVPGTRRSAGEARRACIWRAGVLLCASAAELMGAHTALRFELKSAGDSPGQSAC